MKGGAFLEDLQLKRLAVHMLKVSLGFGQLFFVSCRWKQIPVD